MTDFRALCAELAGCLDDALTFTVQGDTERSMRQLIARTRAELTQPEPEPPADGEVAEIVAELREVQDCFDIASGMEGWGPVITRAADLLERLSQPEPEGPTDEELIEPVRWILDDYVYDNDTGEIAQILRGLITRWGRSAIEPVPVAERLPGAGDCDAEGRCWWSYDSSCDDPFRDGSPPNDPRWFLRKDGPESPNWIHRIRWHIPCVHPTHWLPYSALLVPTSQGETP
jgi:hypothetical protein